MNTNLRKDSLSYFILKDNIKVLMSYLYYLLNNNVREDSLSYFILKDNIKVLMSYVILSFKYQLEGGFPVLFPFKR